MTNIVDWVNQFLQIPSQYEFILYLAAASVLLILFIVTLDFFCSLFMAIFSRRK